MFEICGKPTKQAKMLLVGLIMVNVLLAYLMLATVPPGSNDLFYVMGILDAVLVSGLFLLSQPKYAIWLNIGLLFFSGLWRVGETMGGNTALGINSFVGILLFVDFLIGIAIYAMMEDRKITLIE